MRFGYTIVYVPSVADTIAFYESAFGLVPAFAAPSGEYAEMETGATRLAFAAAAFVRMNMPAPFDDPSLERPAPPIEIGLVTDAVEAAFERAVRAGARAVKAPERKPWGQLVGYVRDLNGILVEICSPMTG